MFNMFNKYTNFVKMFGTGVMLGFVIAVTIGTKPIPVPGRHLDIKSAIQRQ